jgi:predicted HAD superfamily Cof-like phosphohydrolase
MDTKNAVEYFMLACDQTVNHQLQTEFSPQTHLYMNLITEEYNELTEAFANKDTVEVADALADLIWVIEGMAYSHGIPLQRVWDEVTRSNHSKIPSSGKAIKRADGKILKPDTYSPPNIKQILCGE